MLFARLANLVTSHYKVIIAIWIIVLFYVFPLTFKINDVVVYQETEVGLEGLEAVRADEIISANFQGQVPPSTIMVVIQDQDVLSEEVRDFTWLLYEDVLSDARLRNMTSVSFLYSVVQSYIVEIAVQTAPAEYMLYSQANQTAQMVFGVPLEVYYGHMATMAQMGLTPTVENDTLVSGLVLDGLEAQLTASGADAQTIALTLQYANAFYGAWLPSRALSDAELGTMISQVSFAFFSEPALGDVGTFALAVSQSFSVQSYSSAEALLNFTLSTLSSQTGFDGAFLEAIWTLGPSPTAQSATVFAESMILSTPFRQLPPLPQFMLAQFVNVEPLDGQANNTMLMVIPLSVGGSSDIAEANVRALREIVQTDIAGYESEISVYVSGDPALNVDMMDAVEQDTSKIDVVTVGLVIVLVGLYFRSALTPWVPLMTVGMAFLTSTAIIYVMGTLFMSIHYSVMTIVLTVMLGAGTDYCIFIMSRYREERILGRPKEEAVRTSLTWAGESIATSGATVMIGFGALMIGDFSLIRSMGMALVIAVGMALLFSLTMLPSLLMVVGDRIFWPSTMEKEAKKSKAKDARGGGYFRKSAKFSLKNRTVIVAVAVIVAMPAAYMFFTLESSYDFMAGLPSAESKTGIDALGEGFGKGTIMPTYVVVVFEDEVIVNGTISNETAAQLETYSALLDGHENVRSVTGPTRPFGTPIDAAFLDSLPADEGATYEYVISSTFGQDNRTIMLTLILQDQPFTTHSIHTIDDIRAFDSTNGNGALPEGTEVYVGGSTASMADISRSVSQDFSTMRIVVFIGIFIVLMLVLGSLLIPLRLILTVMLNVVVTIAMTMLIFQVINGMPVLWMMPMILFVIAMGLGMDYDIFLTTRIREEVSKGASDEKAITTAVERTGGIITACGLVMAGAFGSMMLSRTALLQEFGFGLAFAILFDAMLVRIYVVPAIMLLLQKWNWYAPGRLQRVRRENKTRKD